MKLFDFLRGASLALVTLAVWYLMVSPSIELTPLPSIASGKVDDKQRELAKIDLTEKVYKEIQARLAETNEWVFRKFTLAGGVIGCVFVAHLVAILES